MPICSAWNESCRPERENYNRCCKWPSGLGDIAARLPGQVDKSCLHMQLMFLGNVTKEKGLRRDTDVADFFGGEVLHLQTQEQLREVGKFFVPACVWRHLRELILHTSAAKNIVKEYDDTKKTNTHGFTARPSGHFGQVGHRVFDANLCAAHSRTQGTFN